jgi:hypothetical protein
MELIYVFLPNNGKQWKLQKERASGASSHKLYNALVRLYLHKRPDNGLVVVRNMLSQIMINKDHS